MIYFIYLQIYLFDRKKKQLGGTLKDYFFFIETKKLDTKTTIFLEKNIFKPVFDLVWSITTQDKLTNQLKEGMCAWPATPAKSAGKRVVTGRDWIFSQWLKKASDYYPKPITKHIIFAYLCPRFNEFQKVRPGLVDLIFPLGDSGSVSVTCANKLITHSIRGCHLFRSSIGGISCEIAEFLNEQLLKS